MSRAARPTAPRWVGRARLAGALLSAHTAPALTSALTAPSLRRRLPGLLPALYGRGRDDHVALTFDDGPVPASTGPILDELARLGLRATFFVLGARARAHPDLLRAAADAGHEIALHGESHDLLLGRPLPRVRDELARARDAVHAATGRAPTWFRPPYGVLTLDAWVAARSLDLRPVLWSAWGRDWADDVSAASVAATVTAGAAAVRGGDTLLLHDADHADDTHVRRATRAALPALAGYARTRGLALGPLAGHGVTGGLSVRRPWW